MGGLEVLGSRPLTYTHTHRERRQMASARWIYVLNVTTFCVAKYIISKTLFIETI